MAVIDMDNKERAERDKIETVEKLDQEKKEEKKEAPKSELAETGPMRKPVDEAPTANGKDYDSDEYEEVEVTDDEDEEARKRQKLEEDPAGPVEFNEDDIAYQLAAMGQDADGGGAEEEWADDYEEEPPLSEEDAKALFVDLLEDHHINPFTPWESIVEEGKIVDDERYTCLPNMKSRRATWEEWSRAKMQAIREQKARQEKTDPRVPYMAFLQKHATPKLYWPEFKRKFRKEAEMKDTKLLDRDREKWYREYINRMSARSLNEVAAADKRRLETPGKHAQSRPHGVAQSPARCRTQPFHQYGSLADGVTGRPALRVSAIPRA